MTNTLHSIAKHCYELTEAYLSIACTSATILSTQKAILQTKKYFLEEVFSIWDPREGHVSFSYNGGKDCQVLLIMYLGCLWEFFVNSIVDSQYGSKYHLFPMKKLPTVYIDHCESFETLQHFVQTTVDRYSLSLYESPKKPSLTMPQAFENYLRLYPETKAIVIGIRHTDPYAGDLIPIQKTDSSWPSFMRIQPILHWKLENIWSFLLYSGEEICGLYSLGFTSIGDIGRTARNPYLLKRNKSATADGDLSNRFVWEIENAYGKQYKDGTIKVSGVTDRDFAIIHAKDVNEYYPGWYMTNDSLERAGRTC